MLIFRVETADGRGPYAGRNPPGYAPGKAMDFQGKFKHDTGSHPVEGWDDDLNCSLCRANKSMRWAFVSVIQLRCWFDTFGNEGYAYLKQSDYLIGIYEVPDDRVWQHKAQVTYDSSEAVHVRNEELPCMQDIYKPATTCVKVGLRTWKGC